MTLYIITKVARQINGELVFIQVDKVFDTKEKAEKHFMSQAVKQLVKIQDIDCYAEYGIIEHTQGVE